MDRAQKKPAGPLTAAAPAADPPGLAALSGPTGLGTSAARLKFFSPRR